MMALATSNEKIRPQNLASVQIFYQEADTQTDSGVKSISQTSRAKNS